MLPYNIQLLLAGTLCLLHVVVTQPPKWSWDFGPCILRYNEPCEPDDVKFTYYNSYDRDVGRILDVNNPDAGPWFDPHLPTKVVIHGYNVKDPNSNVKQIYEAYLNHDDYNIINVEWWKLSSPAPCITAAAYNAPHVGKCMAHLLLRLEQAYPGFEPWRVHVIGFSMGAHIAGHASGIIKSAREMRFERITGLDPATSLKSGFGKWWTLDAEDADFVDVIHTNAGIAGIVSKIGDVDFYVNGGSFQNGCNDSIYFKIDPRGCSHIRAAALYAESVNSAVGFWGIKCASLYHALTGQCPGYTTQQRELMGDRCLTDAKGLFHVNTRNSPPYAIGYE